MFVLCLFGSLFVFVCSVSVYDVCGLLFCLLLLFVCSCCLRIVFVVSFVCFAFVCVSCFDVVLRSSCVCCLVLFLLCCSCSSLLHCCSFAFLIIFVRCWVLLFVARFGCFSRFVFCVCYVFVCFVLMLFTVCVSVFV